MKRSEIPFETVRAHQRPRIRANLLALVDRTVQVTKPGEFTVIGILKINRELPDNFVAMSRNGENAAYFTPSKVAAITHSTEGHFYPAQNNLGA